MFEHISKSLLEAKVDIIPDKLSQTYIYAALSNLSEVEELDFNKMNASDIIDIRDNIFDVVAMADEDGYCTLDPHHPYSLMRSTFHRMHGLEQMEKQRPPSKYSFL